MILELGLLLAIQPTEEGEEEDYQTTVAEETEETQTTLLVIYK